MNKNSPIRKLPNNTHGKDYVVGDLHGCYSLLERLLDTVHFDKSRDRLFSVGDLIDRGPDSLCCLQLLEETWFYAVQGNHELMMLDFFRPYLRNGCIEELEDDRGSGFLNYGGDWIKQYFQIDQQRMTDEFNRGISKVLELPLIWVVGEGENRFHVIHAELVRPDHRSAKQVVWLDSDIDCWLDEQTVSPDIKDRLYWGRTLMTSKLVNSSDARIQPGLSTTFCGHTLAAKPRHVLSHLCIDTGAFVSLRPEAYGEDDEFSLTLFDVKAIRWLSASYQCNEVVWGEHPSYNLDR